MMSRVVGVLSENVIISHRRKNTSHVHPLLPYAVSKYLTVLHMSPRDSHTPPPAQSKLPASPSPRTELPSSFSFSLSSDRKMAKHLILPSACTVPFQRRSSLYPNCPHNCRATPSRSFSVALPTRYCALYSLSSLGRRLGPVPALDSDAPDLVNQESVNLTRSKSFQQWDWMTAKFSGAANIPFLLLQMPQITLNARNLLAGNKTALLAVPWLGMLTGLLGNLTLLSYFAKKREKEVIVVQTLGVISIYIVITQLAMGEAMPLPYFFTTSVVVAAGLVLNFLNYFGMLNAEIWRLWEDFITVGGLSVLPQVMWSTFVPYVPNSILPGAIAFIAAVAAVIMARTGKLSEKGVKFVGAISGWTATLLFMWMPVSQMWTNFLNPDNIRGLSAFSMLLAMIGNGLMIPRALFIRDFMWFTGSSWASLFYGYGNILCMYCFKTVSRGFFLAATVGLVLWIGLALWRDTVVYGYSSPLRSLKELVFGS